jgi:ankyrin repeat protein
LINALGNTPLSEAIKNKRMDNALFLLQSCDDANKIQETVTLY